MNNWYYCSNLNLKTEIWCVQIKVANCNSALVSCVSPPPLPCSNEFIFICCFWMNHLYCSTFFWWKAFYIGICIISSPSPPLSVLPATFSLLLLFSCCSSSSSSFSSQLRYIYHHYYNCLLWLLLFWLL